MLNPDLTHYGLFLSNVSSQQYENQPVTIHPEVTLTFRSLAGIGASAGPRVEQLASDMTVMNKVRMSHDPAVTEAYEQLLTVMALTSGRNPLDVKDSNK